MRSPPAGASHHFYLNHHCLVVSLSLWLSCKYCPNQAEIVKFSDYQKRELGTEVEVESNFPEEQFSPHPTSRAPWFGASSGSLPHLNRPCLVHNGGPPTCPTHGPRGPLGHPGPPPANGCLPGQTSKYSGFSPERVIWSKSEKKKMRQKNIFLKESESAAVEVCTSAWIHPLHPQLQPKMGLACHSEGELKQRCRRQYN